VFCILLSNSIHATGKKNLNSRRRQNYNNIQLRLLRRLRLFAVIFAVFFLIVLFKILKGQFTVSLAMIALLIGVALGYG